MCWQGKMHLGTLEMSLRDFDEELESPSFTVRNWIFITSSQSQNNFIVS